MDFFKSSSAEQVPVVVEDNKKLKMILSREESLKCSALLEAIDRYYLKIMRKEVPKFKTDEEIMIFLMESRHTWLNKPMFIEKYFDKHRFMSQEDKKIIMHWKNYRVCGDFIYLGPREEQGYELFFSLENLIFYGVVGMGNIIHQTAQYVKPAIVGTVLLPFGDKITYSQGMSFFESTETGIPLEDRADMADYINKVLALEASLKEEREDTFIITGFDTHGFPIRGGGDDADGQGE